MPLVFVDKYIKGYEFDHDKVAKAFNCEPHSPNAYSVLDAVAELYRASYIAAADGHLPENPSELKIVLVLAFGNENEELKREKLENVEPWFEEATKTTLTGPNAYIRDDRRQLIYLGCGERSDHESYYPRQTGVREPDRSSLELTVKFEPTSVPSVLHPLLSIPSRPAARRETGHGEEIEIDEGG